MSNWKSFPHDASGYIYAGASLEKHWPRLHLGDCEPFPDVDRVTSLLEAAQQETGDEFGGDPVKLSETLRQAWRQFHCGEFHHAVDVAAQCGLLGHVVASKSSGIYATNLEPDETNKENIFKSMMNRSESAIEALPDDPNAHYFSAYAMGRYSQSISVVKALKQGLGGKIQHSLETALEMQPNHAEAHTAMALYHAEIIDKIGKLIGGMTYGASTDTALEHFEQSLELTPEAPIAHIEYGNGLYLLFGDKRIDEVTDAYITASELSPMDAMERLDIALALSELE